MPFFVAVLITQLLSSVKAQTAVALAEQRGNAKFSASSIWEPMWAYEAKYSLSGWAPDVGDDGIGCWVSVNLGADYVIKSIGTRAAEILDERVTSYKFYYRPASASSYTQYPGTLNGNTDNINEVKHSLSGTIIARWVRFNPQSFAFWPSMRFEIYGYPVTLDPTENPSGNPTAYPTDNPTNPTVVPTEIPSNNPTTSNPTSSPSNIPTGTPTTAIPTTSPSNIPSKTPTTAVPSLFPSDMPTEIPSLSPSNTPTEPTQFPSNIPTTSPTTSTPTFSPSNMPSESPMQRPTLSPTFGGGEAAETTTGSEVSETNTILSAKTHDNTNSLSSTIIVIVASVSVVGTLLLIAICWFTWKRMHSGSNTQTNMINAIDLNQTGINTHNVIGEDADVIDGIDLQPIQHPNDVNNMDNITNVVIGDNDNDKSQQQKNDHHEISYNGKDDDLYIDHDAVGTTQGNYIEMVPEDDNDEDMYRDNGVVNTTQGDDCVTPNANIDLKDKSHKTDDVGSDLINVVDTNK